LYQSFRELFPVFWEYVPGHQLFSVSALCAGLPAQNVQVAEQRHRPIETSGETPYAVVTQSVNAPAYLLSSVSSLYAASTQEDVDGLNGSALGAFSFTGTGQYLSTQTATGSISAPPSSGSIVINSDGSGSLNSGSFPFVTNGTVIFAIPSSGDPLLYVFRIGDAS
jgi:hypothetical protein